MMDDADVVGTARRLLDGQLGDRTEAAFVYGSIAAGKATAHSDIDLFVITRDVLAATHRTTIQSTARSWQRKLGFQPDHQHPIELFSIDACVEALHAPLLLRALYSAGRGDTLDPGTFDSDCLEVLRAMLNPHLLVRDSPVLASLVTLAHQRFDHASSRHGISHAELAHRIGLKHHMTATWPHRRIPQDAGCAEHARSERKAV